MDERNSKNLDAVLLTMIQRHDQLWAEWDQLAKENEDHPRIDAISRECCDLELKIVGTPVQTRTGLEGKLRIIRKAGFIGDDRGAPPTGDVVELVDTILALDAERIASTG